MKTWGFPAPHEICACVPRRTNHTSGAESARWALAWSRCCAQLEGSWNLFELQNINHQHIFGYVSDPPNSGMRRCPGSSFWALFWAKALPYGATSWWQIDSGSTHAPSCLLDQVQAMAKDLRGEHLIDWHGSTWHQHCNISQSTL